MDKVKADVIEEFKDMQSFFDLLGPQYSEGFEDFRKQAIVLFLDVEFSYVQIYTTILMTPRRDDEVVDIKDGDEDTSKKAIAPR